MSDVSNDLLLLIVFFFILDKYYKYNQQINRIYRAH
jgi:hypothetical protein